MKKKVVKVPWCGPYLRSGSRFGSAVVVVVVIVVVVVGPSCHLDREKLEGEEGGGLIEYLKLFKLSSSLLSLSPFNVTIGSLTETLEGPTSASVCHEVVKLEGYKQLHASNQLNACHDFALCTLRIEFRVN